MEITCIRNGILLAVLHNRVVNCKARVFGYMQLPSQFADERKTKCSQLMSSNGDGAMSREWKIFIAEACATQLFKQLTT